MRRFHGDMRSVRSRRGLRVLSLIGGLAVLLVVPPALGEEVATDAPQFDASDATSADGAEASGEAQALAEEDSEGQNAPASEAMFFVTHTIRAENNNGFARLLISAKRGEKVEAKLENGILLLTFDAPKKADLTQIKKDIPDYVALARSDKDGLTYRFALKQDFKMQQSRGLQDIAIDLVPEDTPGMPEKLQIVADIEVDAEEQDKEVEEQLKPLVHEHVGVRVSEIEAFTRISFDWPRPVEYTADLDNSVVTLKFSAIGDPDLTRLRVEPPKYVYSADKQVQPDGTYVGIKLARRANIRHHRENGSIVIDVFEEDGVSHFTDADAIVKALDGGAPPPVIATNQGSGSDNLGAAHSDDHASKSGVDHHAPEPGTGGHQAAEVHTDDEHHEAVHGDAEQSHAPAAVTSSDAEDMHEAGHAQGEEASEHDHVDAASEDDAHNRVPGAGHDANGGSESASGHEGHVDDHVVEPAVQDKHNEMPSGETHGENAHKDDVHADVSSDHAMETAPARAEQVTGAEEQANPARVSADGVFPVHGYDDGTSYNMIFEWGRPVPAAVFKQDNTLRILFDDQGQGFDLSSLNSGYGKYIVQAAQSSQGTARMVQVSLVQDFLVDVAFDKGTWTVSLRSESQALPTLINFQNGYLGDGRGVVRAALKDHSTLHTITDPVSGDDLVVVTAFAPVRGVLSTRHFVEFNVLESSHGLVVRPLADKIYVRKDHADIVIGSERQKGLIMTRPEEEGGDAYAFDITQDPGRIDLVHWAGDADETFADKLQRLQTAAVVTPDVEAIAGLGRGQAAQARFYIAHGLAHEALGILSEMRRQNEDVEVDPSYLALRGVAYYMAGRYPLALKDLSFSRLEDDPDARLWRAATLRRLGRFGEARQLFQLSDDAWGQYPVHWQNQFHLAAADSALATKDLKKVERHLTLFQRDAADKFELSEIRLLEARLAEAMGDPKKAEAMYQDVIARRVDPYATYAEFDLVSLKRSLDQMAVGDAIDVLSRLQYTWRGDDLEFEILHELGKLHIDGGQYRTGLTMLRDVLNTIEDADMVDQITGTLSETFTDLYLRGDADEMSPIKALGLYYEFRELTPIGKDGDDMIRKLVDRLIAVDLLGQAAELLDHQVRNRLSGIARSQVAARLALIYLMDQRPDQAMQILRTTRQTGMPRALGQDRRLIEARALTELKRFDHALELVEGYYDIQFERLRADIYWESQEWQKSGDTLRDVIERTYVNGRSMTERQRSDVLRCAVSYSLAEDQRALAQLEKVYGPVMGATPDADAFEVLTAASSGQDVDFRRLAAQIAGTNTLDAFMEEMSARFNVNVGS